MILPCLGRTEIDMTGNKEQFVTTESTMLNVQLSKGILEPASDQLRSETWIIAKLARVVLGAKTTVEWERMATDYDVIRRHIGRVVEGCEDYNAKVQQEGGFYLPNPPREGKFPTDSGKAKFKVSPLEEIKIDENQLLLTTIRSHDQFNTTVYDLHDRYRGINGSRRVILMNEQDIAANNLKKGEVVDITSHFEDGERYAKSFIVVPYPIPPKCAAAYFPETNVLVPVSSVAEKSNCPTSKLIKITVAPHLHNGERVFSGEFAR